MKIGRNDPCYCGSGKKYKKCCGSFVNPPIPKNAVPAGALNVDMRLMGLAGEALGLVACNQFREADDPRNVGGPKGLPGKYRVTFLLERPGYRQTKEYGFSFTG